jgi:serine/threonine protein kinase
VSGQVRDKLARIASRPAAEWTKRIEQEFPGDPAMRMQALLWLHSDKDGPENETDPPSLGESADERYELAVRIDSGATASVWLAYDRRLGRDVAIKVFHQEESEALEQVLGEARAASVVVSEHVVRVLDVQYGDGHPYIVMELVAEYDHEKGESVLGRTVAATKPRDVEEVARWVMHVARGVHEAHLRNVFHRDLKPKNVLVTPNSRRARVADFGLAVSGASADAVHPSITLLKKGPSGPVSVRGTPEYMAPEQARGLPLTLDARNAADRAVLVGIDVWGLGAIAYELLTGRPPWLSRSSDDLSAWEIAASAERLAPLVRTQEGHRIPSRLRRIVENALASDPKARYTSAAAVANELQAFLDRKPTTFDRSRVVRLGLWSRRNPQLTLFVVLATALTAIAVGTHATVTRLRRERTALNKAVEAQKLEQTKLNDSVKRARDELDITRNKLAFERQNLTKLETSIGEERGSYQSLIQAKEDALRDATASSRKIMDELEASRRERSAAEVARTKAEQAMDDLRREGERAAKDRDRIRREREAARSERDASQRERDAAITERDAAVAERETVQKELTRLKAELERLTSKLEHK